MIFCPLISDSNKKVACMENHCGLADSKGNCLVQKALLTYTRRYSRVEALQNDFEKRVQHLESLRMRPPLTTPIP